MQIQIELENGYLPDMYGKYADPEYQLDGHPIVSFPFSIQEVPENTQSLALTFLDWDAISTGGFCFIHWIACDLAPDTTCVPQNASVSGEVVMTQGYNSVWSPFIGSHTDPRIICRYTGPYPPDKDHRYTLTLYALDKKLELPEGFYLNDMLWAMEGHVLEQTYHHVMSRC